MRAWTGAGLGLALGWLVGCPNETPFIRPIVAFRCDPSATSTPRCPVDYTCCSDDAATFDGPEGEPLFSQARNDASRSGMCVLLDDIIDEGLDEPRGCPVPCNPTWDAERIADVCGEARRCCQTVDVHEDDCVFDEAEGRWRPADGRDAEASLNGGTSWRPTAESTHQDPDFSECERLAGDRASERFRACVRELGTASQRGYCITADTCPAEEYENECEAMN